MNGTIVSVVRQGSRVTGAVRVNDGDGLGDKEYVATVSALAPDGSALTAAQVRDALVAAWQAQRAARPQPPVDLSGQISGQVTL